MAIEQRIVSEYPNCLNNAGSINQMLKSGWFIIASHPIDGGKIMFILQREKND